MRLAMKKRGQVAIFIIVALVIVAGILVYFLIRNGIILESVPEELKPVFDYYTECIKNELRNGADIAGSQGGRIDSGDLIQGSSYAPFSNQLDFLGNKIPYWYYVSGNGINKENVPTIKDIEREFNNYLKENINCDFGRFESQGFIIELDEPTVSTVILDNKIESKINSKLTVTRENMSASKSNFDVSIDSRLGTFYKLAYDIYSKEKTESFLESYSIDVLRLYAPVTGTELSCAPLTWTPSEVFDDIQKALEANMQLVKVRGSYYENKDKYDGYFVVNLKENVDQQVRFLYSKDWAHRFEVWPVQNGVMIANPVGPQEGVSAMGFCYVPYKFVYDLYFPVLVQVYDGNELFQFPLAVVINKNTARVAPISESIDSGIDVCENSNLDITVNSYANNLDSLEANIVLKCLGSSCNLGKTEISNYTDIASLNAKAPQCTNAILVASASGYKDKKIIISTNDETNFDIVLERAYNTSIEVYVDGKLTDNLAVLSIREKFDNYTDVYKSIGYPYTRNLEIGPGDYKFDLKVYNKGSVTVPQTTSKQCFDIPRGIVGGLFGLTKEECKDITIPSQTISNMLYAGGHTDYFITESQLNEGNVIKIYASGFGEITSLDQVEQVYDQIEAKSLDIEIV